MDIEELEKRITKLLHRFNSLNTWIDDNQISFEDAKEKYDEMNAEYQKIAKEIGASGSYNKYNNAPFFNKIEQINVLRDSIFKKLQNWPRP